MTIKSFDEFESNEQSKLKFEVRGKSFLIDASWNRVLGLRKLRENLVNEQDVVEKLLIHALGKDQYNILLGFDLTYSTLSEISTYCTCIMQGIDPDVLKGKLKSKTDDFNKKLIDFDNDMGIILSSFRSQYGVDLYQERNQMTYTHFMTLIQSLSRDTPMGYRMYLRNGEGLSDEEKKIASEYIIETPVVKNSDGTRQTNHEENAFFNGLMHMAKKKG